MSLSLARRVQEAPSGCLQAGSSGKNKLLGHCLFCTAVSYLSSRSPQKPTPDGLFRLEIRVQSLLG